MEHSESAQGNAAFGSYLKKVREGRRLSLDAVEELSAGFPEKVTKSHLSRIENGLALPSFPRLMALSHIYGMPIASLAERYELDLRRGMTPVDLGGKSDEEVLVEIERLRVSGRHEEALPLVLAAADRVQSVKTAVWSELQLHLINCLVKTGRFELAKAVSEELLSSTPISHPVRLKATEYFSICCMRLGRYSVALMALDQVATSIDHPETPRRIAADLSFIRGSTYLELGEPGRAAVELSRARDLYLAQPNTLEACRAGLVLAEAYMDASRFEDATAAIARELVVAESNGFDRLRAVGFGYLCVLGFRKGELDVAEAHAIRSNTIARPLEHIELIFRNTFYLWKIARTRGDVSGERLNERSLRSTLGRIEAQLAEADEFRGYLARGDHDGQE